MGGQSEITGVMKAESRYGKCMGLATELKKCTGRILLRGQITKYGAFYQDLWCAQSKVLVCKYALEIVTPERWALKNEQQNFALYSDF